MEKDKKKTQQQMFQLLKSVLAEAFQAQTILLHYPYADIAKIDNGLRSIIWTNYNDSGARVQLNNSAGPYHLMIIRSNLGFYNILAFISDDEHPDFISVGPLRDEELSPDYYTKIIKEANFSPNDMMGLKSIYEKMPLVQTDTVMKITQNIISTFIPEFETVEPRYIQYSEQNRAIAINTDLLQEYNEEFSELYRDSLFNFLKQMKSGDSTAAKAALKTFLDTSRLTSNINLREHKLTLHHLNNYCHTALLNSPIHPVHVLKLTASLKKKIENTSTQTKLVQLSNEICRKYCLLVKNYSNPEYSKLIRDVITYVQIHLEEELSLQILAEHFGKNPSVLSNSFSKETGQSLTKFIQQTRIQEALRLLNTTDLSISDVAITVGYQDFSYFSKIFTRNVGCCPREYKRRK